MTLLAALCKALTLSLLVLPVIVIATQEALRTVPNSLRQAALALGATRWQMVRDHVLPAALPGILTGTILSLSRAIGETAPLLMVGAALSELFAASIILHPWVGFGMVAAVVAGTNYLCMKFWTFMRSGHRANP